VFSKDKEMTLGSLLQWVESGQRPPSSHNGSCRAAAAISRICGTD